MRTASTLAPRRRCFTAPSLRSLLLASVAAACWAAGAVGQTLQSDVESLIKQANLGSASVAVELLDVRTGEALAEVNADTPFIPASNMKLLTTGAAILTLGADHRFTTELKRSGDTLYIVGSGDPGLADPKLLKEMGLDVEGFLARWVEAVQRSGEGPIREIVIDDSAFEPAGPHPSWPKDQLNRWYCAEVSGLNFFTNVIHVFASPTRPGASPSIRIEPRAPWLTPANRARSVTKGANTVWVSRALTSNAMTLHGEVRAPMSAPIEVAVHDPAMVFGRIFADRLEAAGLGSPSVRRLEPEAPAVDAPTIALVATPLPTALRRCNTDSHNLYAECLLKAAARKLTGLPGSWKAGAAVVRMTLADLLGPAGLGSAGALVVADGSGMSRDNRVTASILAHWLAALTDRPNAIAPLWDSLPRAGLDGTLRTRFRGVSLAHPVRAKSGYLDRVSCLTGFVGDPTDPDGPCVVFSVLVNDIPSTVPVRRVKKLHERIVELVDERLGDRLVVDAPEEQQPAGQGG